MKKITIILSAFILILSVQSYAQEATPLTKSVDPVEYNDEIKDVKKVRKVKRKREHKRIKQRKRANKRQIKAMRKVARADGDISPQERAVIKKEKRKMKRKARRDFKRKEVKRKERRDQSPERIDKN